MNDLFESGEVPGGESRFRAVEQLLQDAGGLIDVSQDLRSRTLDHAQFAVHDRRVRRCFLMATLAWIGLAGVLSPPPATGPPSFRHPFLDSIVTSQDVFVLADAKLAARQTDLNWALVDVFQELRGRRADQVRETSK